MQWECRYNHLFCIFKNDFPRAFHKCRVVLTMPFNIYYFKYMKVKVPFSCVWLFVTPWTVAHQSLLVHRILQARILEGIAIIPFSRGSSQSRDRTSVSCTAGRFFTIWWAYLDLGVKTGLRLTLMQCLHRASVRLQGEPGTCSDTPRCLMLQGISRYLMGLFLIWEFWYCAW